MRLWRETQKISFKKKCFSDYFKTACNKNLAVENSANHRVRAPKVKKENLTLSIGASAGVPRAFAAKSPAHSVASPHTHTT